MVTIVVAEHGVTIVTPGGASYARIRAFFLRWAPHDSPRRGVDVPTGPDVTLARWLSRGHERNAKKSGGLLNGCWCGAGT